MFNDISSILVLQMALYHSSIDDYKESLTYINVLTPRDLQVRSVILSAWAIENANV